MAVFSTRNPIKLALRLIFNWWTFGLLMGGMFATGMWMTYGPDGIYWTTTAAERVANATVVATVSNPLFASKLATYVAYESGYVWLALAIAIFSPFALLGLSVGIPYGIMKLAKWAWDDKTED